MKNILKQNKPWIYCIALVMAFNGGYINSICLVSLLKNPAGYLTGDLMTAGSSIVQGNFWIFACVASLAFTFLLGSIVSGLVVSVDNHQIDRRYSISLSLQTVVVLVAMYLLLFGHSQANYLLAFCMGMQNAMMTHYGSALIRTTHMTGTTTDLGILIGHWMKGCDVESSKMLLYAGLIASFAMGGIFGALIYGVFHPYALLLSVLFYTALIAWRWLRSSDQLEQYA